MSKNIISMHQAESAYRMGSNNFEYISLYYHPGWNMMEDENGEPFYDIFRIIPPWRYRQLKEFGGTEYVRNIKPGVIYELVFPFDEEECERECAHFFN